MIKRPLFWDYEEFLEFDEEEGMLVGISSDAPKEAIESFKQFMKEKEEALKEGLKI